MPRAERSIRVEAIILRHTDWGEADRLITLYTREQGKIRAIAKGARKIQSRKAGHLEPFTRVALMLAKGADLWIVTQAEARDLYSGIQENLQTTVYASYVVELLDRFTIEEGANPSMYKLLQETLFRLASGMDPFIPIRYYELRLLDILGYRPLLFECAGCGAVIEPRDQFFSANLGGVLCPKCSMKGHSTRKISLDALRFLRHFQRSTYAESSRANPPTETRQEMEAIQNYYFSYLLERNLNSPEFMRQIQNPKT